MIYEIPGLPERPEKNRLLKHIFLLFFTLPAFSSLKAMGNEWQLLGTLSKATLLYTAIQAELPWQKSVIGTTAGACSISLWYCHAKSKQAKQIEHHRQGLYRSARNIHQKLDSLPQPALVCFRDEPIGCIPNYARTPQREQGPSNLPDNSIALRGMLQELDRRHRMLEETIKIDDEIFLDSVLPMACAAGLITCQLISALRPR